MPEILDVVADLLTITKIISAWWCHTTPDRKTNMTTQNESMHWGQKFRELRTARGFSIKDVAIQAGIAPVTLSCWERVTGMAPTPDRVRQLARTIDLDEAAETELLELANAQRGYVSISFKGLSREAISALTVLERASRDGHLTPQAAHDIVAAVARP